MKMVPCQDEVNSGVQEYRGHASPAFRKRYALAKGV